MVSQCAGWSCIMLALMQHAWEVGAGNGVMYLQQTAHSHR